MFWSAPAPLLAVTVNGYWVHDLSPFLGPHWGNIGIRYYGLAYLLGFAAAGWLLHRYALAGRSQLPSAKIADLLVFIVGGVMLGGRIGSYVFYHPEQLLSDPLSFFRVWEGGMASHGGFIGVALALWWFARSEKIPFLHLGDLIVSTAGAGLCLGRVANFINGERWGTPTRVAWAVIFPAAEAPGTPPHLMFPRHPSQLYEAALEGLVLIALMQWRFWRSDVVRMQPGRLSGEFVLAYAVARAICEVFREPDAGISLIFGLSRGTFYSTFLVAAGVVLIVRGAQEKKRSARETR
jgi:phosphatidylglycerol:prolipoprotein diacylglycerol transferase